MTDTHNHPICQWCQLPTLGTPTQWNGRPQCRDPHACERRRQTAQREATA